MDRHVSLNLTLTNKEAVGLIYAIFCARNEGYLLEEMALSKFGHALEEAMEEQPENILFLSHESAQVLADREVCSFCEGYGATRPTTIMQRAVICSECEGTGKS